MEKVWLSPLVRFLRCGEGLSLTECRNLSSVLNIRASFSSLGANFLALGKTATANDDVVARRAKRQRRRFSFSHVHSWHNVKQDNWGFKVIR